MHSMYMYHPKARIMAKDNINTLVQNVQYVMLLQFHYTSNPSRNLESVLESSSI